jgi:mRNA interferase MazF
VKRGDLVTIAIPGDFGKPRPALVIQADRFDQTGTVTVLLVSATQVDAPPSATGLRKRSQVMVDKAMSVKRERIGSTIGQLDTAAMVAVTRSLAVFLGIA